MNCKVADCDRWAWQYGLCRLHYNPEDAKKPREDPDFSKDDTLSGPLLRCKIADCKSWVWQYGLCRAHYNPEDAKKSRELLASVCDTARSTSASVSSVIMWTVGMDCEAPWSDGHFYYAIIQSVEGVKVNILYPDFQETYQTTTSQLRPSPCTETDERNYETCIFAPVKDPDITVVRAVQQKNFALVKKLVEGKASLESTDDQGGTALIWAAHAGNYEVVSFLVKAQADVNSANKYNKTPLMYAARGGDPQILGLLLKSGAKGSDAALLMAANEGVTRTVKYLIDAGVKVDCEDCHRATPLIWASQSQHADTVKLLLEGGANVSAQNKYGKSALYYAERVGNTDIMMLLMDAADGR